MRFSVFAILILGLLVSGCDDDTVISGVTVPSAPLSLTGTTDVSGITLSWNTPETDGSLEISDYTIYRESTNEEENYFSSVGSALTTFADTCVEAGVTYSYTVAAVNLAGESIHSASFTITQSGTPPALPGAPLATTPTYSTAFGSYMTLSWDAPGENGSPEFYAYKIYRKTGSSGPIN